jgi:hypothetical protein
LIIDLLFSTDVAIFIQLASCCERVATIPEKQHGTKVWRRFQLSIVPFRVEVVEFFGVGVHSSNRKLNPSPGAFVECSMLSDSLLNEMNVEKFEDFYA